MPVPNWSNIPQRYARSFDVINVNFVGSPFFFMHAATTGVAGMVMAYDTVEDYVNVATSGTTNYSVAGFLMQDVKDLDSGAVKGYRNLNNTVANLGDNVTIAQGNFAAFTKTYNGSPAFGNQLQVSTTRPGYLEAYAASNTGSVIAIVEAINSPQSPTIEPPQLATTVTGPQFIRIYTVYA